MAHYFVQLSYAANLWAAQLKAPTSKLAAVKQLMDTLGGRIVVAYYSFGEDDLVFVADLPSDVSAAAASRAFLVSGAVKSIKTTPLMVVDEEIVALEEAPAKQQRRASGA